MKRFITVILISSFLMCLFAPSAGAVIMRGKATADLSHVRVQLVSFGTSLQETTFTLNGDYYLGGTDTVLSNGTLTISLSGDKLSLYGPNSSLIHLGSEIKLTRSSQNPDAGYIKLSNDRKYLGDFSFRIKTSDGKKYISIINTVPTVYYLYGVLKGEMGNDTYQDALKAQALSAKSYVLSKKSDSDEYDVGDTSRTQVYHGYDPSWNNIIKAVNDTANEVVLYDGEIMYTLYASSNGGETDIPSHAWGSGCTHLNPGYAVTIDEYDFESTGIRETLEITLGAPCANDKLCTLLMHYAGENVTEIVSIDKCEMTTPKYDGVERNMTVAHFGLSVKDAEGTNKCIIIDIPSQELLEYKVFTNSNLKTYWGKSLPGGKYAIYHARNGHGVGLSQRAAKYRAALGHDYKDILEFYFPGSTIGIISSISDSLTDSAPASPVPTPPEGKFSHSFAKLTEGPKINVENAKENKAQTTLSQKPQQAAVTDVYGYVYAKVQGTYMYSAASSSSTVINRLNYGDMLLVLDIGSEWLKVCTQSGMTGYVRASDVTFLTKANTSVNYSLGSVTADSVNFRAEPTTNSTSYGKLDKNTVLYIWGTAGNSNNWYYVQYGLTYGYVYREYINITGTYTAQEPASGSVIASGITNGEVNLRPNPSTSNNPLKTLKGGTYILIYGLQNGWYHVFADGLDGYVSESYVTINTAIPIAPSGVPSVPVDIQPIGIGTINATNVRFRSSPDTSVSNNIITLLQRGDKLTLFSLENDWYYASFEGTKGYVAAQYVDVSPLTTPEVTEGELHLTRGVTTGNINFREGAGTDYAVYKMLQKGTEVEIIGKHGAWYFVRTGGVCGFVTSQYVTVTQEGNVEIRNVAENWKSYVTKTTDEVNFRLGPSTAYSVIEKLPKNVSVTVLVITGEWCLADYNGTLGYISHDYLAK